MNFTSVSNLNQSLESDKMLPVGLGVYLSEAETAGFVVFVVFFGSVGLVLNLVLILSIYLTEGFSDAPANVFVLNLACADFLLSCVSAPLLIYNMYYSIFAIFITVNRFIIVATTGSIFLLTLNRLVSIVRSLKYQKIMTFKRTVTMIGAMWFLAILVLAMAVAGLTLDIKPIIYITHYVIIFYITSSVAMCVYMYSSGRKHRQRLAQQAYAVTGQTQETLHEFRALRSLLMVPGSFAACWLPVTIAVFFVDEEKDPVQYYRTLAITAPLGFVNSVIDPVVFYYRSNGFTLSLQTLGRRLKNAECFECCSKIT